MLGFRISHLPKADLAVCVLEGKSASREGRHGELSSFVSRLDDIVFHTHRVSGTHIASGTHRASGTQRASGTHRASGTNRASGTHRAAGMRRVSGTHRVCGTVSGTHKSVRYT